MPRQIYIVSYVDTLSPACEHPWRRIENRFSTTISGGGLAVRIGNFLFVSASLGALTLLHAGGARAQAVEVPSGDQAGATGPGVQGTGSGSEDDGSLQEIVVTGFRASLQAAQRAKRSASEVAEAITPEDLGKLTYNIIT